MIGNRSPTFIEGIARLIRESGQSFDRHYTALCRSTPKLDRIPPLSHSPFADSVETAFAVADKAAGKVLLSVRERNQFWVVLPSGILPDLNAVNVSIPYLRFTTEGRAAILSARLAFATDGNVLTDFVTAQRFVIEFAPCVIVGRNAEGRATVHQLDPAGGPPPPEAVAEDAVAVADIGEVLDGLRRTRSSLDTVNSLLENPAALLVTDEQERCDLHERIAATRDHTLVGLERLGAALSCDPGQAPDAWRRDVSEALEATLEAMVSFGELGDCVRDDKREEMARLRVAVEGYLNTLDPLVNADECRKFSSCVNLVLLEERKTGLTSENSRLEQRLEVSYESLIASLQTLVGRGSSLPMIPYPMVEPAPGCEARLSLNMIHIVMAVRFGGLSLRLNLERHPRLFQNLQGWDESHPPTLHIVDRDRFIRLFLNRSRLPVGADDPAPLVEAAA
jgi:hypothetical protein